MKQIYYTVIVFGVLFLSLLFCNSLRADTGWASKERNKNIIVLVIDSGIDAKHPMFYGRSIVCPHNDDCVDFMGHGTHVASLILNGPLDAKNKATNKVCDHVIVHSCDYKPTTGYKAAYNECLDYAKWLKPDIVNFSSVGPDLYDVEYKTYESLPGTTFIVAAGNDGDSLYESPHFPAVYPRIEQIAPKFNKKNLPNVVTVSASTSSGSRYINSNYADFTVAELGVNVNSAAPGTAFEIRTGTSMAAAIHTNKLIQEKCHDL